MARSRARPGRPLPPLDYDDDPREQAKQTTGMRARRKGAWFRWLVLGVALGIVVGAGVTRGDLPRSVAEARTWGATWIRSLERRPPPPQPSTPAATMIRTAPPASKTMMPACSDVSPDNLAALLAPFDVGEPAVATGLLPTVSIEDLPRVVPDPPKRIWRPRRVARPLPAATTPAEEAPDDGGDLVPVGNPYLDHGSPAPLRGVRAMRTKA